MKTSLLSRYLNIFKKLSLFQLSFLFFTVFISFLISLAVAGAQHYQDRIYLNTYIDQVNVSGLTREEALAVLEENTPNISDHLLELYVDDISVSSSSSELGVYKDYPQAINEIMEDSDRSSKVAIILNLIQSKIDEKNIVAPIGYKKEKIGELIGRLSKLVLIKGENPNVSLELSGYENSTYVFEGTPGREINISKTRKNIEAITGDGTIEEIKIAAEVASTSTVLGADQEQATHERARKFVGESIELKAENNRLSLSDKDLVSLIKPLENYDRKSIISLVSDWAEEVNRDPQDAEFVYDPDSLEVEVFKPHRNGLELNKLLTVKTIEDKMVEIERKNDDRDDDQDDGLENKIEIEIPLKLTNPEITLENTNNLGIKEIIGFGESFYHHSIINRVHNVGITAERISLAIVPPGEEFSFNKQLGEVSSRTGFRSAYVISGGKTVLGDGGGVCQVSSTLFRAVLDAGLDVSKRLQHSYRVSYYELNSDPGFDATVYSGEVDFRFINDTENHVLIYAFVDEDNRYMNIELYGTSDGRTTEISNYKKWGFRSPPAPEYFPTSELPTGATKQVDWSVSGIKTEFTHTIKDASGEVKNEDVYYSNYRPWSAKYLVGI